MFKRRITVEQLAELTEEQKQKLREWWKPTAWDVIVVGTDDIQISNVMIACTKEHKDRCLPLLDIGQMIELLSDKLEKIEDVRHSWKVVVRKDVIAETYIIIMKEKLCDALWQAVKQVLGV